MAELQNHDWPVQSIAFVPARAAFGSLLDLALWCAGAIVFYVGDGLGFARRFVANAAAVSEAGGRKKLDTRTAVFRGGGVRTAMVRKNGACCCVTR